MAPILVCSVVSLALLMERAFFWLVLWSHRDETLRQDMLSLEHNEALGARPALARTHLAYACFLESSAGTRKAAAEHRKRATALATELGMARLLERSAVKSARKT